MKMTCILLCLFTFQLISAQKKYDFDIPWRATSNEGILDWFLEKLDDTSGQLLCEMFDTIGVDTDNIQWIFPSKEFYTLHKNGWDYYSRNVYFANNEDKTIQFKEKNCSEHKLPYRLYGLDYFYDEGVTTLILVEYY